MFAIWYAALAIEELRKTLMGLRNSSKRRTCSGAPCPCIDNASAANQQLMESNGYKPTTSRITSEIFEPAMKPPEIRREEKKVAKPNTAICYPTHETEIRPPASKRASPTRPERGEPKLETLPDKRRPGGGGSPGIRSENNSEKIVGRAQIELNRTQSKPNQPKTIAKELSAFEQAIADSDSESESESTSSSDDESYRKTMSQLEMRKSKHRIPGTKMSQVILPASILGSLADTFPGSQNQNERTSSDRNAQNDEQRKRDFMEEKEERKRENIEYERELMERHRKSIERRNQKLRPQ